MLASSRVVGSGIPLMIVILASVVIFFARAQTLFARKATMRLKITGAFCALVWLFYYAEIWSPRRIPVFDIGAPLIALLALIVLPVLAILVWLQRRVLTTGPWQIGIFVLSNVLILFSLAPGIFIVLFFGAAMRSGR